jgi:hypothetical protein
MDVAAWLRGLGLERYAPAFRDNDVDGEVLPELTADDLIRRAWLDCGAITVNGSRPTIFSPWSTAGSPKASTPSI